MEKNIVKNSPVRRPAKKQSGHGRRAKKKHAAAGSTRRMAVAALLVLVLAASAAGLVIKGYITSKNRNETQRQSLSESVLAYEPLVKQYARENGIEDYEELLLAIMQVESGGEGNDVMQSSESLGLAPGSLMPEESIRQGCSVFAALLKEGEALSCDLNSVIQAYNFGITYLYYVADHGKIHTFELAQNFAKDMSGGETAVYVNALSEERNGGWRYNYGNMFYVELVRQYCPE